MTKATRKVAQTSPVEDETISACYGEFERLSSLGRPFCFIDSFRKGSDGKPSGKIGLRLVSSNDEVIAAVEAHKFAKQSLKDGEGLAYEELYRLHFSYEILRAACFIEARYQEDGTFMPLFLTVELARRELSQDEREYLLNGYLSLRATKGALKESFDDSEDVIFWAFMMTEDPIQTTAQLSHSGMVHLLQAMSKLLLDRE